MSVVADARRALNARACFALVDLAYALRDGRIGPEMLPAAVGESPGLSVEQVQAGHDCIMVLPIERRSLDAEVRACVAPLAILARSLRGNDPDAVVVADRNGRTLLSARHLEYARRASEPMTETQAKALLRERNV